MITKRELEEKALELIRNMPEENVDMVVWDDELHICDVPSFSQLAVSDHAELIKILRLYPYSPFYGHTER